MGECEHVCEALKGALGELPIFPLGSTVFFPHTLLPLFIFEPRYRQMTEAALGGHKMIAVVSASADGEVAAIAGVGRIVHHERLHDGRFHILLQGLARVELVEELPADGLLFRRMKSEIVDSVVDDDIASNLRALQACYDQLAQVAPTARDSLGEVVSRVQDPGVVADVVCAAALSDPGARQAALSERSVARRLAMATEGLADLLLSCTPEADVVH